VAFSGMRRIAILGFICWLHRQIDAQDVRKIKIDHCQIVEVAPNCCSAAAPLPAVPPGNRNPPEYLWLCREYSVVINEQNGFSHLLNAFTEGWGADGFECHVRAGNLVFLGALKAGRVARPGTKVHEDVRRAAADIRVFFFLHKMNHRMHHVDIEQTGQP